jgi:hypothetical protein
LHHREALTETTCVEAVMATNPICSIPGCSKVVKARLLCSTHYKRAKLDGTLGQFASQQRRLTPECVEAGCAEKPVARNLCPLHYDRWRRHGDPTVVLKMRNKGLECRCGAPAIVRGYCSACYSRWKKYGTYEQPQRHCEICGARAKKIHFDHDHSTGKHRGWLCYKCNAALGLADDSIPILQSMISYLERANAEAENI